MGWLTTGRGETLRGKAKDAVKGKVDDAKDAVNPKSIIGRHKTKKVLGKGGTLCIGCGKPIKNGRGNVHAKGSCQRAAAGKYKSIHEVD
jgi:hypothetical protein